MIWGNPWSYRAAVVVACALFAPAAVAAHDTVKVGSKVAYVDKDVGTDEVRECHWDERLIEYLVKYSKGQVEVTDQDLDKTPGKTLKLFATAIHTSGGAAFSGPKWLKLRAELRVDGKLVSGFEKSSHSTVDPFRWTACSVMVKMSKQLGRYTAKWLNNPVNAVDTGDDDKPDAEPVDASAPTPEVTASTTQPAAPAPDTAPQAKEHTAPNARGYPMNPPPLEKFSDFGHFELDPITMDPPYAGQEPNEAAAAKIQEHLQDGLNTLFSSWGNTSSPTEGQRTLRLQPHIEEIKFIGGGARYFAGALAGSSHVTIKVRYVDAANGTIVAEPQFSARSPGSAGFMGIADNAMLGDIARMVRDYTASNHDAAIGGAMGETSP